MLRKASSIALILCLVPAAIALADGGTTGSSVWLPNPIACDNLICLFLSVIRLVLGAIGVFALFMFIYGGFLMMSSAGNADQVKKAKDTLVWATLGLVVILGSWVFLSFVLKATTDVTSTSL